DHADNHISVIPDFISNCGMARVFAYLMSNDLKELTDKGIFEDTSNTIYNALKATHAKNNTKTNIAKTAFEIALKQLI
ncbi:MAG TPA: amino acid dehydrogenase, partial [Fluviicola sp.]|nr:amino acid dehydrogenase [Fluviicola sp.]